MPIRCYAQRKAWCWLTQCHFPRLLAPWVVVAPAPATTHDPVVPDPLKTLELKPKLIEALSTVYDPEIPVVTPRYVQADEIWTFVHTKEKRVKDSDPLEYGDAYVWIALDSETKAVLSYHVGRRDGQSGYEFVQDLSRRVTGRFQFTSDGHDAYPPAIEEHFGADIDFAQLVKNYAPTRTDGPDWFGPSARVVSATPKLISGNPVPVHQRRARRVPASY